MKRKLFGIVLIVVIVALAYFYIKGKSTNTPTADDSNPISPGPNMREDNDPEMWKIRQIANEAHKDLKGWSKLHPDPYKPIVKFTQAQFAKFVEFYKILYPKGFQHHIDNQGLQGLAWNRTSDLYQLKLALNRLLATV